MKQLIKLLCCLIILTMATFSLTSCSNDKDEPKEPSLTEGYIGKFSGQLTLNIAGRYEYDTETVITISEGEKETLSVTIPEYALTNTVMGDITMGSLTLDNLIYDSALGGFYLNYGNTGIGQYFKAERDGTVTMNDVFPLNDPSDIIITRDEDGKIKVVNSFRIGSMPMPIVATFIEF